MKSISGCTDPTAVNYSPNANEPDGSCVYGRLVSTLDLGEFVWDKGSVVVPVLINNKDVIGGFQFAIEGGDIINGWGGVAADNGFMISTSKEIILAFSLSGDILPTGGEQILVYLQIKPHEIDTMILGEDKNSTVKYYSQICIGDFVVSTDTGQAMDVITFNSCIQP